MNKKRLRSFMALHGDVAKDLADWLNITEQSLLNKINEKGTEFKQGEINRIRIRYNLSPDEVDQIFFAE